MISMDELYWRAAMAYANERSKSAMPGESCYDANDRAEYAERLSTQVSFRTAVDFVVEYMRSEVSG